MSISLNSKSYDFSGVVGRATQYIYRGLGLQKLFSFLTVSVESITGRRASKGAAAAPGYTKVKWNLRHVFQITPEEGACCPAVTEAYNTFYITGDISELADPAVRADFLAQVQALVLTTEFTASVTNLTQPYA